MDKLIRTGKCRKTAEGEKFYPQEERLDVDQPALQYVEIRKKIEIDTKWTSNLAIKQSSE